MKTRTIILFFFFSLFITASSLAQSKKAQDANAAIQSTKTGLTFAGKKSGNITKEELLSDSAVFITEADSLGNDKVQILSFKVTIIRKGQTPILNKQVSGNKMPQQVKGWIMTMYEGDILLIDFINTGLFKMSESNNKGVNIPHKVPFALEPISFKIIDK